MEQTLHQLGQLLLSSIPTILLFVGLHLYLKKVLYGPLRAVLARRAEVTSGRVTAAQKTLEVAESRLTAYEAELRQARERGYQAVEARRQAGRDEARKLIEAARQDARHTLLAARQQLATETAQTRQRLEQSAGGLAEQVVRGILGNSGRQPGMHA